MKAKQCAHCILWMAQLRQQYMPPLSDKAEDRTCYLTQSVYWHLANQSLHWPYNLRVATRVPIWSHLCDPAWESGLWSLSSVLQANTIPLGQQAGQVQQRFSVSQVLPWVKNNFLPLFCFLFLFVSFFASVLSLLKLNQVEVNLFFRFFGEGGRGGGGRDSCGCDLWTRHGMLAHNSHICSMHNVNTQYIHTH